MQNKPDARDRESRMLRDGGERLHLALDAGRMGLWDWDPQTNQSIWDEREFELLDVPATDGPVDTSLFFDRIHEEDRARIRSSIQGLLESGTEFHEEFRIRRADGEVRWLSGIGRLYRDENGRPRRFVGVHFDITARKQTDARLRTLNETLEEQVRERTSALAMLRDIASMANQSQDVEEALNYCLRRVCEHNGWCFGHAFLPAADDGDLLLPAYAWYAAEAERFQEFRALTMKSPIRHGRCLPGKVFVSGRPEWSTDIQAELSDRRVELAEDLGLRTGAAFPVMTEDRIVGVLEFFSDKSTEPKAEMLESMASVGIQLGRVIERRAFQDRLLTLSEEEHRRLGQELHDDVGQEMTGLALNAETLAEMLERADSTAANIARRIVTAADRVRRKTQALSRGLVPLEIDAPGLEAALEGLALQVDEAEGIFCRFHCRGAGRVDDSPTATQLYRIAQEAVANALRHSGADRMEIVLAFDGVATTLEISDNGRGLPVGTARTDGMGMQIMRYRAGLVGGQLRVESAPGGGTRLTCRLAEERA